MMSYKPTAPAYSSALLRSKNKSVKLPMNIKSTIDLNTDLGQARDVAFFASEAGETLLSSVSSVNLPCFVHDGVPSDILSLAVKAKAHHCTLGAHIAYPDPMSLGYDAMADLPLESLQHWILVQLGALQALLKTEHLDLEQVRPHGALYLAMFENEALAKAVVQAVQTFDVWLPIILPACAITEKLMRETTAVISPEFLLGRRYQASGLLELGGNSTGSGGRNSQSEWLNGSATAEQIKQLLTQKTLTSVSGTELQYPFKTLHISPAMPEVNWVAEKVQEYADTLVPLALVGIAESGWVQAFNDRREEAGDGKLLWEEY